MHVVAVCAEPRHGVSKQAVAQIELIAGRGVRGDAHCGGAVQHLFDRRRDPARANVRQVHLVEAELIAELRERGFALSVGDLGENIVTQGIALDALPLETRLHLGNDAVISITGLREPCVKMDRFRTGLRAAVTAQREAGGRMTRQAVMAIVLCGGIVKPGEGIRIEEPASRRPLPLV